MKLTPRQQDVFSFIQSYLKENGYVPSLKDIQLFFNWKSRAAALWHMKALTSKGFISDANGRARAYRLLKKA